MTNNTDFPTAFLNVRLKFDKLFLMFQVYSQKCFETSIVLDVYLNKMRNLPVKFQIF